MRLLHVISSMAPEAGGTSESVRQRAIEQVRSGDHIEVLCQDDPGAAFLSFLSFPVHAMGSSSSIYGRSPKLLGWLRQNATRFDGIVVEGVWQYFNVAVRQAALGRVPYAVFPHGMLDPWFKEQYPLKHVKKLLYWLPFQYPVLRDARAVLFTTPEEQRLAPVSFWPNRWNGVVVPFGIEPPPAASATQTAAFYETLPTLRGRRFLLFLSRIHIKKGCDLLLKAFARISATAPDLDLVLAGPDSVGLRPELETLCISLGLNGRVHWPGMLTGDVKWGAFRACEAFVLPSHQENFGVAVVEAMACAKPVLISNKVNIWEEIEADRAGLVAEDTEAGTETLLRRWLSLAQAERVAMGANALACYRQRYSMERCAAAIRNVFGR